MARSCVSAARLARTMFAWSALASRFARARVEATTALSSRPSAASVGAEEGEELSDRVHGLRVGDGVPASVVYGEAESLGVR